MTQQKRVLLEELRSVKSHPTADEVYSMIKERLPNISLGTVYRNLVSMSDAGVIRKLPGSPMRFDGDTSAHYHIRCEVCSKVGDIQVNKDLMVDDNSLLPTNWKLTGSQIEFSGICPECQIKRSENENGSGGYA